MKKSEGVSKCFMIVFMIVQKTLPTCCNLNYIQCSRLTCFTGQPPTYYCIEQNHDMIETKLDINQIHSLPDEDNHTWIKDPC